MKAIVQTGYGSPDEVLEIRDIDKPVVEEDEVLIQVRASSMHPDVWHVVTGQPYVLRIMGAGLLKPKNPSPGTEVAGRVESVGKSVTRFQPGDEVFGEIVKGHQWKNGGAFAEYVSAPEDSLELKPSNLTFEQAAAIPTSALIALQGVRYEGRVQPGQRVLVNGAGGGVGIFALQIAKSYGGEVTGVDSGEKLDMLRSIGADKVIDYTREDFTRSGERYDLIVDVPGNHTLSECRRALTPEGTYVLIGHDHFGEAGRWFGGVAPALKLLALSPFVAQVPGVRRSTESKDPLVVLNELIEAGKLTPVIDSTFPLSEVPEAIRYMAEEGAKGKIVITV